MKKIIQLWAVVVSFVALFNVGGAAANASRGGAEQPCGYCDVLDEAGAAPPSDLRRRHSDLM